jgi:hypothetical protein
MVVLHVDDHHQIGVGPGHEQYGTSPATLFSQRKHAEENSPARISIFKNERKDYLKGQKAHRVSSFFSENTNLTIQNNKNS